MAGTALYAVRALAFGVAPIDEEQARRGHSALLGHTIRQGFAWTMAPLERAVLRSGISPDTLTIAGTAIGFFGAAAIALGDLGAGGAMFICACGFDFFDGRLARRLGASNRGGEFLDSTLDRYSDACAFGAAAFLFRDSEWNLLASLVAFGATTIVPYARAKAEALGTELKSGLMQRPERVVLYSAAAVFGTWLDPLWPAVGEHPTFAAMIWFLALATSYTAIARTRDGLRAIRARG